MKGYYSMKKLLISIFLLFAMIFPFSDTIHGSSNDYKLNVLIIYSPSDDNDLTQIRLLDSIVGQFTNNITIMDAGHFTHAATDQYSDVIYFGLKKDIVPLDVKNFIEDFKGTAFVIGYNIEQFDKRYSFITTDREELLTSIQFTDKNIQEMLPEDRIAVRINKTLQAKNILLGQTKEGTTNPIMVSKDNSYYLSCESLFNPMGNLLSEVLHDLYSKNAQHKIYLRLEDIHPKTDPDTLLEIAKYLKKEHVPYMAVVIPEYTNQKTKQTLHLADSPKLVKTLQYMQANGGSIVLHGYKHQYRSQETGEGFEYWDVKNDRPILQRPNDKITSDSITKEGLAYEHQYILNSIRQGVQQLVAHKLYPLAFEAPHYAMSQMGYDILAKHFSTYIGQAQLTDKTWKSVYAPLSESQPRFLKGMTLLPETLGYMEQGNPRALSVMKQTALDYEKYSGSYLSCFYHPYLGVDTLKKVVTMLKALPNSKWVNLKEEKNVVNIDDIKITSHDGSIQVHKNYFSSDYEKKLFMKKLAIWCIPIIIIALIVLFAFMKRNKNHRLKLEK